MIWIKTDAGRAEMQMRALVKERPQRNLLLVIDGTKSEEMLLAGLAGVSAQDFTELHLMGLIVPVASSARGAPPQPRPAAQAAPAASAATAPAPLQAARSAPVPLAPQASPEPEAPGDYAQFTEVLTQMISKELGLRGFVLTLAVEKAGTPEELQAVAQRTIKQIRDRKGEAAAAAAQRALYGS